jgi:ABC-2 type transport system ATP-binding protein
MTPAQFLEFIASVRGFKDRGKEAAISSAVARTQLQTVLDQPIETLSKGFKRRVGLAQAILHDPPVLILDEPTDGLDPNQKFAVRRLISAMAKDKAIIISTHILEEVDVVCTRAVIIDQGRIVVDGTPEELAARSRYHNAVTLDIGPDHVDEARSALAKIEGVSELRENGLGFGVVSFTLFPEKDKRVVEEVSALTRKKNWDVRRLIAESGRLDEVFRKLTTADAGEGSLSATPEEDGH